MSEHTPLTLLERLRAKPDQASWRHLVDIYTPWLDRFLRHAGLPAEDAEDLRQEVLEVLVKELPTFEHNGRTGAFRRWLRNIVFNRLRVRWRQRKLAGWEQLDEFALQSVEDPLRPLETFWDQEHDAWVLQELIRIVRPTFTETTWEAFYRQVFEGARAAEVAKDLGMSVNSALLAKSRVLKQLRLEAQGFIDDL